MPENSDIIDTLDLLYKVYKIFGMESSALVKRLLNFLDHFVYENEGAVTPNAINKQMHQLGDKLLNLSLNDSPV